MVASKYGAATVAESLHSEATTTRQRESKTIVEGERERERESQLEWYI